VTLEPGTRLGPYEVVAAIGAGGMGTVYRARDTRLGRNVAIRVLPAAFAADPDRLRRFEQEARAIAYAGFYLAPLGRMQEALEEVDCAVQEDPLNVPFRGVRGMFHSGSGSRICGDVFVSSSHWPALARMMNLPVGPGGG